jgi:hypothetical protein
LGEAYDEQDRQAAEGVPRPVERRGMPAPSKSE